MGAGSGADGALCSNSRGGPVELEGLLVGTVVAPTASLSGISCVPGSLAPNENNIANGMNPTTTLVVIAGVVLVLLGGLQVWTATNGATLNVGLAAETVFFAIAALLCFTLARSVSKKKAQA